MRGSWAGTVLVIAWNDARLEGVTGDLGGPGEAEGDPVGKSEEVTFLGGSSTSGRASSPTGSGGDGDPESESRLDMPESKLRLERLLVRAAAVDMNGSRRRCFRPLPSLTDN